ncbi:hypothetical protein HPP92_024419 [Vanilla planifolia]|uniref:Uncharacterized protein n=1 Tax=Vanilla planifolia TaxID=51239 RepID=A0A835PS19_VANPL|nr:hypothetical protein HPP92_024419 [Vanilla planifolia]
MKNLPLIAPNASPSSSRRLQETQVVRRNPRHFQEGTTPTQAKAAWWIKAKPQRTRQIFPEPKAFNDPPVFPLFRSGTVIFCPDAQLWTRRLASPVAWGTVSWAASHPPSP